MVNGLKRPSKVPVKMNFIETEVKAKVSEQAQIIDIDKFYAQTILKDRENYYKSKNMFGGMW
jgi:hypothetical protein